ncbi:acetyl-CoA carboxylase biotin carboxylase subunit [Metabacillus arenae]|uniref:biotin carboxylase n=1 Tax=Metabacillus arenae TaxID=2771434 RepID=A0A926NKX3_9BACI|nr:acetyl-CoA carboxylase biotin carboxylase subunit [Metabacillus arenae]MBD1379917.1 acetyl-CoA carboxylase biotin carboxylase subunit [Metabacillus arenae]
MKKILIANRGEISKRIIATCNEFGIKTVAIYSDADKELPYVKEATSSYRIGEPPVPKSYMKSEEIINVATREKVDAIHPGYGFLSESAQFARKVENAGIHFVGPNASIIELMGDKVAARKAMEEAGVPSVPGSKDAIQTIEEACSLANEIGYPVMLKASGGGGGIGMQKCINEVELMKVYQSTKHRAKAYFGNDEVFVEKYIENGRHIEVQLFSDEEGNVVHLFERDCSIQRRNQKVIEESPSPFLSAETREKMFDAAIKAAKHVQYVNAGTIEFIVDENEQFYFLEMNTRLQVEHRVTEMLTGIDLVKWQLLIANGERLPLTQEEIPKHGHAMEFRLYAEDPITFTPSPGKLKVFYTPEEEGVIIDAAYQAGNTVTPFYDPLIAKVIIHANTRREVIVKSKAYFDKVKIEGIKTNVPLFKSILKDKDFIEGNYHTGFLQNKSIVG